MKWYEDWARSWGGIQGTKSSYNFSARSGNHSCPLCRNLLQVIRKERVVNSESEEAKDFDFRAEDGRLYGNTKFKWDVFYCAKCNAEIDIADVFWHERKLKKAEEGESPEYMPSRSFREVVAADGRKKS